MEHNQYAGHSSSIVWILWKAACNALYSTAQSSDNPAGLPENLGFLGMENAESAWSTKCFWINVIFNALRFTFILGDSFPMNLMFKLSKFLLC